MNNIFTDEGKETIKALIERRECLGKELDAINRKIAVVHAMQKEFGVLSEFGQLPGPEFSGGRIRDRVLGLLSNGHSTASELRKHFPETHEKTIGMTLYRLKKEGLVARLGTRVWALTGVESVVTADNGQEAETNA